MTKRHSKKIWKKSLAILLCALILAVGIRLIWFKPEQIDAAWYNDTWRFRVKLTIDHTKVGADQTDFPIYVDLSLLPAQFHEHVNQTDARDIRVTKADGSTELPREIVNYNATSNSGELHVKYSGTLSSSIDTSIYIYYGNPSASDYADDATYGAQNVWDTNYLGVWHLSESTPIDSTSNNNDGTATGASLHSSGKIGGEYDFASASNESIDAAGYDQSNFTVSLWVKTEAVSNWKGLLEFSNNSGQRRGIGINTTGTPYVIYGTQTHQPASADVDNGSWRYVTGSYNGTNAAIYIDGQSSSLGSSASGAGAPNLDLKIGNMVFTGSSYYLNGALDEARVSSIARSSTWISTEYNNQNSPATFFTEGAEEQSRSAVLNFSFDEGHDTIINDSSSNGYTGTLSGATPPSWQSEGLCISGKCLYYQGSTAYTSIGTSVPNVQSVSFWVKPKTNGETLVDFDGGTHYISASAGTITATGFSSPTIYVNGKSGNTLTANAWQHIEVTTATSFTASSITIGKQSTNFFNGFIDEFTLYDYARSSSQVKLDFTSRSSLSGVGARFGPDTGNTLSNGLVGYWKMDENTGTTATDFSGNGNVGTLTNTPAWITGKYGSGVYFDPLTSNKHINVPAATSINNLTAFTLSVWVNPSQLQNRTIFNKGPGFELYFESISSGLRTQLYMQCSGVDLSIFSTSADNLTFNTWHHIVVTSNGRDCGLSDVQIFIDGLPNHVHANSDPGTGTKSPDSSYPIQWGAGNNATAQLQGSLDEARIYNRALSPAEIQQLYNWSPGPQGSWKMDENTGTTIYDTSGNGYNGTFQDSLTTAGWTNGKYGSAVSFVGANKSILALHSTGFDFGTSTKFSVGTWVKVTADTGSQQTLIAPTGVVSAGFELYTGSDGKLRAAIGSGTYCSIRNTGVALEDNAWHYVEAVFNRGSGCTTASTQIYIDGMLEPTAVADNSGGADANIDTGGIKFTSSSTNDSVILDNVVIYNYARTPGQIIEDMNAGHPAPGSPIGSSVAYWKFDEGYGTSANDSSINANTLTLSAASWTNSGKFEKAWNGDGANWLSIADASTADQFDFAAADDFTISAWIKSDSTTNPASTEYILSKAEASAGYRMYVENDSSGTVSFGIDDDATWTPGDRVGSIADIYDSTWHHVVAIKQGTTKIQMYVDGKLTQEDTSIAETGTLANAITLYLGDRNGVNGGDEFFGDIDEVKIFRSALTSDQVKVLYTQSSQASLGTLSTDASNNPSSSANDAYCPPGQGSACTPPILHYKMDENTGTSSTNDSSTNGYTGTLNGSMTAKNWATGKYGSAVYFDGTDDNIQNTSISLPTGDFTYSTWIYPTAFGTSNAIFGAAQATIGGNELTVDTDTDGDIDVILDNGALLINGTNGLITVNNWHHVVVTRIGSTVTTYINGAVDKTATDGDALSLAACGIRVGTNQSTTTCSSAGSNRFQGRIDEFKIYNYGRTPAQVAWDYNRGAPSAWWKLDECTSTIANDSSGNGYSGTINIGATGSNTSAGTCTGSTGEAWKDGSVGKFNASLEFDGTDDYVSITNPIKNVDTFSASVWIYPTALADNAVFVSTTNSNYGWALAQDRAYGTCSDGEICVWLYNTTTGGDYVDFAYDFPINQWSNWIVTFDRSSGLITFYVNGKQIYQTTTALYPSTSGSIETSINRGYSSWGPSDMFLNGQMDDIRIYNYPLTPQQIGTIINEGAVRFGPQTGSP